MTKENNRSDSLRECVIYYYDIAPGDFLCKKRMYFIKKIVLFTKEKYGSFFCSAVTMTVGLASEGWSI